MFGCFAQEGFTQLDFVQGCTAAISSSARNTAITRWLLKFERTGKTTFLSDVGGEVEGDFYVPAVADVSVAELLIDLDRFAMPTPSATINISPSALEEFFLELDDLGQANVTLSSWDGYTARPVVRADMEQVEWGYNGDPTTFRMTEVFSKSPQYPSPSIDLDAWSRATLASGARFKVYPQVWGDAQQVPNFQVLTDPVYMIVGHNVATLPAGTARYQDGKGRTYIGSTVSDFYDFTEAQGVKNAADLLRLILRYAGVTEAERDAPSLAMTYAHLQQFPVGGYQNSAAPIWSLVANRFQRQFMFVAWQQAGKIFAAPIRPTQPIEQTLVFNVHLLDLDEKVKEDPKYTRYKTRYHYLTNGSDGAGWYGVSELGPGSSPYLKSLERRWGMRQYGDPIEVPLHADSIDLADVHVASAAKQITQKFAQTFHRGQRPKYLQRAEFADMRFGTMCGLVDPDRGYDNKPAILIGRQWLTPEFLVHTYRTIEPFEIPVPSRHSVGEGDGGGGGGGCPDIDGAFNTGWTEAGSLVNATETKTATQWAQERTPRATGTSTISLSKSVDSADWGGCTKLAFAGTYSVHLVAWGGIPEAYVASNFAFALADCTGVNCDKSGSFSGEISAPFAGSLDFALFINGDCEARVEINLTTFELQP